MYFMRWSIVSLSMLLVFNFYCSFMSVFLYFVYYFILNKIKNHWGHLADHHQTCHTIDADGDPDLGMWVRKLGAPIPWKFTGPKTLFQTTSRLDREYLRIATRYSKSENGAANCDHCRSRALSQLFCTFTSRVLRGSVPKKICQI